MNKLLLLFAIILCKSNSFAQDTTHVSMYKTYYKYEIPASLVAFYGISKGYGAMDNHTNTTLETMLSLNADDINSFDRNVVDFPADQYSKHHRISDVWMKGMLAAPSLLFLNDEIRKDWKDVLTLYFETHISSAGLFLIGQRSVRRHRPLVYNSGVPIEERTGVNTNNSFFSGHVNTTASASFFIAKVWNDYHSDYTTLQKLGVYALAVIPPYMSGYHRLRAGKHFRSDVFTGLAVGAATGILIPHLRKNKNRNLTVTPFTTVNQTGLNIVCKF